MDRNSENPVISVNKIPSLSARRAWIEIIKFVNLRVLDGSLSARRAWIEIKYVVKDSDFSGCRSPQGERG